MLKKIIVASGLAFSMASAHFQTVIPETDHVVQGASPSLKVNYSFIHPFEQTYMEMGKPIQAAYHHRGQKTEITSQLHAKKVKNFTAYETDLMIKKPGDYVLTITPEPYFEPAEGKYIQHLTKAVVNAYGMEEGWDELAGLKAEIKPLTRPYGLWSGNSFRGQVLFKGQPVPDAEIEVEFYNEDSQKEAPFDSMVTQVVKADGQGIFEYTMPFAGWWGFAALLEDDRTITNPKDKKDYPVELGAVMWVKTYDLK